MENDVNTLMKIDEESKTQMQMHAKRDLKKKKKDYRPKIKCMQGKNDRKRNP